MATKKRKKEDVNGEAKQKKRILSLLSLSLPPSFFTHHHFFSRAFACTRLFLVRAAGVLLPQATCIRIKIEKRREREDKRRHHFYVHRYASFSIDEKKD
jgi:hypothetical protein